YRRGDDAAAQADRQDQQTGVFGPRQVAGEGDARREDGAALRQRVQQPGKEELSGGIKIGEIDVAAGGGEDQDRRPGGRRDERDIAGDPAPEAVAAGEEGRQIGAG